MLSRFWENLKDGFCKMFNEGRPEIRIYGRLESLWLYADIFDLNSDKLTVLEKPTENDLTLEFKSDQGTVRVQLVRIENIGGFQYGLQYSNYAGSEVFEITTSPYWVKVEPNLGINITADDIDLAIFELEDYLEQTFGDLAEAYSNYIVEQRKIKELHEQELKKLV